MTTPRPRLLSRPPRPVLAAALVAAAVLGSVAMAAPGEAVAAPGEAVAANGEAVARQDELIAGLVHGNARFVSGALAPRDDGGRRASTAGGERPTIAVLGCADARVSPDLVLDRALGELHVVRTWGHVAGPLERANLELAARDLGAPLILVLGHERCGAVEAAVEDAARRRTRIPAGMRPLVEPIRATVKATAREGRDTAAYVEACVQAHVRETIRGLLRQSRVIRERVARGELILVGARYGLASGRLSIVVDPAAARALAPAPRARR